MNMGLDATAPSRPMKRVSFRDQIRLALAVSAVFAVLCAMRWTFSVNGGGNDPITAAFLFGAFISGAWFGIARYVAWRGFDYYGTSHRLAGRRLFVWQRWMCNVDANLNRLPWHD